MLRLSTCSNRSFIDEAVKNFSRVSCRFGQSSNICLTVSGSLQDSQRLPESLVSKMTYCASGRTLSSDSLAFGCCTAAGVLMWEVFTCGDMPYAGQKNPDVVDQICNQRRHLYRPDNCPELVFSIMLRCWMYVSSHGDPAYDRLHCV